MRIPDPTEATLRNGLRVIAVRKPRVPRFELRLRIPAGLVHDGGDGARARLLPETLLAGTDRRDAVEIARTLQRLGGTLAANADLDDLVVSGGALAASVGDMLDLLAEVVTRPSFPSDEVAIARDRVAQEIVIGSSQPQVIAQQAWRARVFGRHRYGRGYPDPDAVRRIGRAPVERFWQKRVMPRGTTLVIVGDIRPDVAVERVARAFAGWKGLAPGPAAKPGAMPAGLPTLVVDRPGAVQTNVRIVGPALPRDHPDYYKLALANTVFGGYFSSRLTRNIREEKGYTYSPVSLIDHRRGVSVLLVAADVGTDVTAPALLETRYELGRMAALPVPQDELDAARRYLAGVTMLQIQTQGGLASVIDALSAAGLGVDHLRRFRERLDEVSAPDVREAALRYLAPRNLTTVMVGDAGTIRASIEAFDTVEVRAHR